MAKAPNIVFEGKTLENYTITKRGIVRSAKGNQLAVSNGRVTLSIDGKRKRLVVKDLINSTYATVETKPAVEQKKIDTTVDAKLVKSALTKPQAKQTSQYKNEIVKPIHDTSTKNISFIKVANELKEAGVKNAYFMLWLNDPELVGINPHNPAITKETRVAIVREILINPWYFLREVVRIENDKGALERLELTKEAALTLFLALNGKSVYTVADKEKKVNTAVEALHAWLLLAETSTEIRLMDITKEAACFSINRIAKILNRLPRSIRSMNSLLVESTDQLVLEQTKSRARAIFTPGNQTAASNLARGATCDIIHINEFEHIKNSVYFLLENTPAFSMNAKRSPNTCARIITTTLADKDENQDFEKRILKNSIIYTDALIDNMVETENGEFVYIDLEGYRIPTGEPSEPFKSKFDWYRDRPDVFKHAITIYNAIDFSVFKNRIPEAVRENILADGHDGFEDHLNDPQVQKMIEDYTIRRIAQTIAEGLYITTANAYPDMHDTFFACFGVSNIDAIKELLTTNHLLMGRFYNLTYEFMKIASDIKLVNLVGSKGQLNAEALHLMLHTLAQYIERIK